MGFVSRPTDQLHHLMCVGWIFGRLTLRPTIYRAETYAHLRCTDVGVQLVLPIIEVGWILFRGELSAAGLWQVHHIVR